MAQAPGGATILVCPGTYRGTVSITGPAKNGLKLIAVGRADEVVFQGDYTERDGFPLENVGSVLIRGFTVRDFGNQATTEEFHGRRVESQSPHGLGWRPMGTLTSR